MPRKKTPPNKRPLPTSSLHAGGPPKKMITKAKVYDLVQALEYVALSAQGKRPSMEDTFSSDISKEDDGIDLYGVFDGHGGSECSAYCKVHLLPLIRKYFATGTGVEQTLCHGFQAIDEEYCKLCDQEESRVDGSTAVVVAHDSCKNRLYVANAGDSRAIVVQDKIEGYKELSEIHLPSLRSERERIEALGGRIAADEMGTFRVEGVLMISRSIGDSYLKKFIIGQPTTRVFDINPERDHCVILASDGLFDVMEPEEVAKVFQEAQNMDELKGMCERVVGTAIGRGSGDNITVLVVPLRPSLKIPKRPRRSSSICRDDD